MSELYTLAKEQYAKLGIDTEKVIQQLKNVSISIHCWQGDDVVGFDRAGAGAGDGIMTTGNYPGRARTPEELMADIDKVLSLVPGKHRINLHACYAIFEDGKAVDRDQIKPEHFQKWVDFAKARGLGLDFNPTLFSHPMVKGGLTLSSPDEEVRTFWVNHCKACREIAAYFSEQLGTPCLINVWIPDGFKDIPADRLGPRARLKKSLDEIYAVKYDESKVLDCVESKVFGIGVESCTVGSHEFYLNYAAKNNKLCLLDTGHYHPTEVVSDKISSMLLFSEKVALHVSRPVRWDSDHVVIFDDELKEIAKEIVRNDALDRVLIALDFFDASINRIAAWTVGIRNMQKAIAFALLVPHAELKKCQDAGNWTEVLVRSEEAKMYPYAEVWKEFCRREGVPEVWKEFCRREGVPEGEDLLAEVKKYEADVLSKR